MRQRQIQTKLLRDEWFSKLTPDEKWFFTYFLVSPDISTVGIGQIPDEVMVIDSGFEIKTVRQLKERMEKQGKLIFKDNWVCIVNFHKHNSMTKSPKVVIGGGRLIEELPDRVYKHFNNKLKELGAEMSLDDYLAIKRRNRARKEVRKKYPSLMGQQLEDKVDQMLGVADSGKVDWAMFKDNSETSEYPTPESVKYEDFVEIGKKYKVRPYVLYWFYQKKVAKLSARGSRKTDYRALLIDVASSSIGKELDMDTKIVAATMYAKDLKGVMLTRPQVEGMIVRGEL